LLKLRQSLELFANIRPVTTFPTLLHLSPLQKNRVEGVDFVIYRELTGGIYFGDKGRSEDRKMAYDHCVYSEGEIERIAHLAFQSAMTRRKKLTLVDKANVLETSRLWRETVMRIEKDYPEVEVNTMFVDNAAMQMILYPQQFDVILTSNMFGDILSDEASVITGSMGLLPSASMGIKTSMFEPIHGSYPQATGKDIANPMATVLSAAMMLDSFGMTTEAKTIRNAVTTVLTEGIGTEELNPQTVVGTSKIGDILASCVHSEDVMQFRRGSLRQSISTII